MFNVVFDANLEYLKNNNHDEKIYSDFYVNMSDDYKKNTSYERVVIDYIAGMTDDYFIKEYDKIVDKKS